MTPGFWDNDEFQESGFASIKKFSAILTDVEDDVEGDYGSQIAFDWSDVELIEAGDDVSLDNGEFTDWIKQSSRKGSTNDRVVAAYKEFKADNELEGEMEYFKFAQGIRIIYERQTYDFGKKINPGTAFVPAELDEGGSKKASKSKAKAEEVEDEDESEELDAKLVAAVQAAVEDEGLTSALLKAALNKKASTRKLLEAAGGIKSVTAALVDAGVLVEDDGVFSAAGAEDEDEDLDFDGEDEDDD